MSALDFESGKVKYTVNGSTEIYFNPTDSEFVEKLFDGFEKMDQIQAAYKGKSKHTESIKEVFATAKKMDAQVREIINGIFGEPVCDQLFGHMNVYALADGLPVWCNFMLALIDEVDTTFAREQKATNPRIKKYTDRYHK